MPMYSVPTSGHGSKIYMEADPVGAQGTFTLIAQVHSDVVREWTRDKSVITPAESGVDTKVVANVINRPDLTFTLNYIPGDTVHRAIQTSMLGKVTTGLLIVGTQGRYPLDDEMMGSGAFMGFKDTAPIENGERKAEVTYMWSGAFKFNGTLYT